MLKRALGLGTPELVGGDIYFTRLSISLRMSGILFLLH